MSAAYTRLGGLRFWIKLTSGLSMLVGLATLGVVAWSWINVPEGALERLAPYVLGGCALTLMSGLTFGLATVVIKLEANSHRIHDLFVESRAQQEQFNRMLQVIRDNSRISDAAKSIAHREIERDALRKAIREDILKEDWEAAYSLIEEMEERFGYRLEAYNYRKEVDDFRAMAVEEKVLSSSRHIRQLITGEDWDDASTELQRLSRLAPEDDRVEELSESLRVRRDEFKESLTRQWREAVNKKDVDRAIQLLKRLDPLLTREEAAEFEDSARQVFKGKLVDLGMQFKQAVTEKRWDAAMGIGEQIRGEFPNSLMAKEVSESMEVLRSKAAASGQSTVGTQP